VCKKSFTYLQQFVRYLGKCRVASFFWTTLYSGLSTCGLNGLSKEDELPHLYTPLRNTKPFTFNYDTQSNLSSLISNYSTTNRCLDATQIYCGTYGGWTVKPDRLDIVRDLCQLTAQLFQFLVTIVRLRSVPMPRSLIIAIVTVFLYCTVSETRCLPKF